MCLFSNDLSKQCKRQGIDAPLGTEAPRVSQVHKRKCTPDLKNKKNKKTVDQLWSVPRDQYLRVPNNLSSNIFINTLASAYHAHVNIQTRIL